MRALLIGNLTIDHNLTESGEYIGIGGSVYFTATLLKNLGVKSTIISPYGQDFPSSLGDYIDLYPKSPLVAKTLLFRNKYVKNGVREQKAENIGSININQLGSLPDKLFFGNDMVIIAPLTDQFDFGQIEKWKVNLGNKQLILLPQGLYRKITINGKIVSKEWKYSENIIKQFNIIVISEKDFSTMEEKSLMWSKLGPIVVVTKEDKGCTVYNNGLKKDYIAYQAGPITDSTGAGDIFAAAFGFAYLKSKNIDIAAEFANASAAMSLRFKSNQLKYSLKDISKFAHDQGRRINL